MTVKTKAGVYIFALVLTLGCGIKGPPLPPIETIEDKTQNGANLKTEPPKAEPAAAPEKPTSVKKKKSK